MRDSCIFYRSFFEAIKELPKENQADVYGAIFEFSLNMKEIELLGISKTIMTLIKPQLEANIKKYHNGKAPKQKQDKSKTKAKQKQSKSKTGTNDNVNVNVNDNVNVNEKEQISFSDFWDLYGKKVGNKEACEKKWGKLSNDVRKQIMEFVPKFRAGITDIKFQPYPETFLNQKRWTNEIDVPPPPTPKPQIRQSDYWNYYEYEAACERLNITPEPQV